MSDVIGYIRTEIDCPVCGHCFDVEGDATGDILECESCGEELHVERAV